MRFATVVLLFLVNQAPPQQRNDDILGVKEWWGQFTVRATHSGAKDFHRWDLKEFLTQNVHIDTAVNAPWWPPANPQELLETGRWGGWVNQHPGSVHQVYRIDGTRFLGTTAHHTDRRTTGFDIGPGSEGVFQLQIDLKRRVYTFVIPGPMGSRTLTGSDVSVLVTPNDPPHRVNMDSLTSGFGQWGLPKLPEHPLPASGMILKGSMRIPYVTEYSNTPGVPPGEAVVDWIISPRPPTPLKLEIEAVPDGGMSYAQWRPKPGSDEKTPGSFLKVTARLVSPPGAPPEKVAVLHLLLTDVSEEKGVSLNFPPGIETRTETIPDFDFDPLYSKDLGVVVNGRRAHVTGKPEIVAGINFFDGGAWGELIAEAQMEDGRYVLGHVKSNSGQHTLLIPQRQPNSKIADMWRSPGADNEDPDNLPVGDPQQPTGDGLTNYEEYRGFHVQGAWTEGDPQKKEFFVRNEAGWMADGGITLFQQITNLRVHRLAPRELTPKRVVNAARTHGPHKVDQHGVVIKHNPTLGNICTAVAENEIPGMPVHVDHVGLGNVPNAMVAAGLNPATGQTQAVNYASATVAHELLHACNVYHHGDPLTEKPFRVWTKNPDGSILEDRTPIRVVDETGREVSRQVTFPGGATTWSLMVYTKEGLASGEVTCVMRYDDAWALEDPAKPEVRVVLSLDPGQSTGEITGSRLCTNAGGNPRFGSAARGNCAGQIIVDDKATRTAR